MTPAPGAVALAEVLPVGVCLVAGDGTVGYVNPMFTELFETAAGSVPAGTSLADLRSAEAFRPAAALFTEMTGRRLRCTLPSGRVLEGAWHVLPDGFRTLIVADATGEALGRRRLRRHNRALAELVATKTELVSALLHEVRTPLTAARSMAAMLPASPDDPLADQALRGVARNLLRLEDVTREIATVSGIENGTLDLADQPVDLRELLLQVTGRHGGGVRVTAAEPGAARGDRDRLAEVFERLINAVRAVHGETVEGRHRDGEWLLRLPLPAAASADQLFTASGGHGNATALMFARAVIGRHGGTVGVESEQDTACLTVRLPLTSP
ncbi:histidine kinase dimerization/phospho-acceptor domain-containing protein [Micromonosporaceae bacterium Da 78-11]